LSATHLQETIAQPDTLAACGRRPRHAATPSSGRRMRQRPDSDRPQAPAASAES
jgi:hypothetical protein